MKYNVSEGAIKEQKTNMRLLIAAAISALAVLGMTSLVSAHGVKDIVEQEHANCYGKVASLHATEGRGGIKAAYADDKHTAVPNLSNKATFQEEVLAIKAYCGTGNFSVEQ